MNTDSRPDRSFLLKETLPRLWASSLIDQLARRGATHFYASPGMRNAPFLAALHHRMQELGDIQTHLGMDERAHAYRALGATKSTGIPSVLICTSGTAAANYLPALIESSQTSVPLIVISADRPETVVLSQDNQTIPQQQLFADHIAQKIHLPFPHGPQDFALMGQIMAKAWYAANEKRQCVHLNVPLHAPLELPLAGDKSAPSPELLESALSLSRRHVTASQWQSSPRDYSDLIGRLQTMLQSAQMPLIVIGEMPLRWHASTDLQWQLTRNLLALLPRTQALFFADAGSGFKYALPLAQSGLPCPDHPEALELWHAHKFDLIVHIGGRTISKNYYAYLSQLNVEVPCLHLTAREMIEDPSARLSEKHIVDYGDFFKQWVEVLSQLPEVERRSSPFATELARLESSKRVIIDSYGLSYPQVSKTLVEHLPGHTTLFLGNSTVPRTFDSYIHQQRRCELSIVTQRGVSGIEGNVSTAIGLRDTLADKVPVAAVLGDVAMIHDLNSFVALRETKHPLIIFIVNNGGGGIFNLLPVAREKEIMPYLTTPHDVSFSDVAKAMGISTQKVINLEQLQDSIRWALAESNPCVVEIMVDDNTNQDVYSKLRTVRL